MMHKGKERLRVINTKAFLIQGILINIKGICVHKIASLNKGYGFTKELMRTFGL
jgi:hypothetical protein